MIDKLAKFISMMCLCASVSSGAVEVKVVYSEVNRAYDCKDCQDLYNIIIGGNKIPNYYFCLDFEQKDPVFDEDGKPIYPEIPITLDELISGTPLVYTIIDNQKTCIGLLNENNALEIFPELKQI